MSEFTLAALTLIILVCCLATGGAACHLLGKLDQPKQKERRLAPRTAEQAFTPKQQNGRLKAQLEEATGFTITYYHSGVTNGLYHVCVEFTFLHNGYITCKATAKAGDQSQYLLVGAAVRSMLAAAKAAPKPNWDY